MEYNTLQKFVSKPRLDRLFIACGNSEEKALKLYKLNLKISQQAYPLLSLFEIFFRNAVYDQLSYYFDDKNWILNQKNGFMSDPSLSQGHFHMREAVIKAENLINKKRNQLQRGVIRAQNLMDVKTPLYNVGKIITEQTFGFWTNLYETHHYRLIGGAPIWCFVNKPSSADRKVICEKLNAVRLFRNKIYHNEHVCFDSDKDQISFAYIEQTVKNIYELLSWIDPELVTYAKGYHRIQAEINKGYKL